MTEPINLIEVYCDGRPEARHKRVYVARMVRTIRVDDSTGWAVARDDGNQHAADESERDRLAVRCPWRGCRVNAQANRDQNRASRGYEQLVRGLDYVADNGASELSLHALAGIVSYVAAT
ncbi:hypothetical protein [Mycobacterium intracellulare]|uniref:hypothetical protein n=1 Tax=Mycobacterium intracellulare TaxID=1767 RepID=UPI0034D498E6